MELPLGPLAALASSFTWAFASARYAQASRDLGPARVNLLRAVMVAPVHVVIALALYGGDAFALKPAAVGWLMLSVICSYGLGDIMFLIATRRVGISTALSIASVYPMWATLFGVVAHGETLGGLRASGIALCMAGVFSLVHQSRRRGDARQTDVPGIALALAASVLWAGNGIFVKLGSEHTSIAQINMLRFSAAVLFCALPVAMSSPKPSVPLMSAWRRILPAVYIDALLGASLYVYGMRASDLAVGATLSSLSPLISVPIAIAFGEERWSTARFVGITATVAGVVLLVSS